MVNPFTKHPKNIGETYAQHFWHAGKFGILMLLGSIACLIHAVIPFLFVDTASNFLFKMSEHMVKRLPCSDERVQRLTNCLAQKSK